LATTDDEVDLAVGLLKCTIGVAPFRRWWWSPLLSVVVVLIVVVLATSIITSIISLVVVTIIMAIITTIAPVVVTPVVAVIATVVIASIIAAIISSIPIIIARIEPTITVISSVRSTVMIFEALTTVLVVVVVASGLFGGRRDSKDALQLLALPHGVFSVAVELALVVYDHIEVTLEEGGRSWWIYHIGFARMLA
jgi:hypothetical protein